MEHSAEKDAVTREMLALLITLQREGRWHPNSPASQIVARAERVFPPDKG